MIPSDVDLEFAAGGGVGSHVRTVNPTQWRVSSYRTQTKEAGQAEGHELQPAEPTRADPNYHSRAGD